LTESPETVEPGETARAGDLSLVRLRILVIAMGFTIVGAAAGGIFDRGIWAIAVAPTLPALVALVLVDRAALVRTVGAAAAVLTAVSLVVADADGSIGDISRAFTSGIQSLLSTDWPSPTQADLLGTVVAVLATACAASAELAARRRFHLLALVPLVLSYVGVVALSAPLGVRWAPLVGLAAVTILFALLRHGSSLADRLVLLRGERRLIPLLAAAIVLVVLASVPVSLGVRADPRRNDPAQTSAPLLDPIEATLALRNLDPPQDLHVVTANDGGVVPTRWRTAALADYDGRRWSPDLTLRPIGTTLGPATGPTVDADVSFLDDNLTLVPLPGPPVEVDAAIETDAERTIVRLAERPSPGDVVAIVANTSPSANEASAIGVAPRVVDGSTSGLTQLAEGLAGDGDDLARLRTLETTLQEEFTLDSNVQGGGLQQALIERFLRDTQRGTSEQFATSFALLARSLGVEARVATGFVADGDDGGVGASGEPLVLRSSDAAVWPEVQLADGTWIAYDPVPAVEASDGATPPPEPQVQTPAAPQPPIAPPPDAETDSDVTDDEAETTSPSVLETAITWLVRGSIALGVIVLPLAVVAGLIIGAKFRRRRRRLGASDPVTRIRGAWASATDALVDAGLHIGVSTTDSEIAGEGEPFAPDAGLQLRRLATLSSSATFGSPRHPEHLAHDATACLDTVEQAVTSARTGWQRLRWRLSTRSLRPATRSPVTD
jgi:transglutaminase-like putative cysteine protease